ncbi:MAG: hypothetical protein FJ299_01875 [Planctomycetes bacterium]|nr:hypothetical protein [Planctomycetota bacterium]
MNPPRLLLLVALLATSFPSATRSAQEPAQAPVSNLDARSLFMTYCAACHGETGDGNGTTKLDRPARSFKDGGFSYGNTPEVIAKTLQYGIPGSVMPSFGKALTDEQRLLLAKHVISLGPQDLPTESPDRVLVVKDRAVVARGKLPPIVESGEEIPRGLLVGTPDGFTFAYRTDDVRLIAVYQGEFAERTDWMGRGGTQLKPLGKLVAELGTAPTAMFQIPRAFGAQPTEPAGRSIPLFARMRSSRAEGDRIFVAYDLVKEKNDRGPALLSVEESIRSATTSVGSGWRRNFRIANAWDSAVNVELLQPVDLAKLGVTELGTTRTQSIVITGGQVASSTSTTNGPALLRHWRCLTQGTSVAECVANVEPKSTREFELLTVIAPIWNDKVSAAWQKEVLR